MLAGAGSPKILGRERMFSECPPGPNGAGGVLANAKQKERVFHRHHKR